VTCATRAALLAAFLLCSCYRFVPETAARPELGSEYRAHLTLEGSQRLERYLGQGVASVTGRVLAASDSNFLLAMGSSVKRDDPRQVVWSGEQITIPFSAVQRLERRELDRGRTLRASLFGGAGLLLAGAIWMSVGGKAQGTPPGGDGTIPP
jgi:hypothetical protein